MTTDTPVTFEQKAATGCPICAHPRAKHDAWGCQATTSIGLDLPALRCRCALPSIALVPKPGRQ